MCVCVFARRDAAESAGDVCLSGETLLSPLVMCVCVFARRDAAESAGDVCLCVCQERRC